MLTKILAECKMLIASNIKVYRKKFKLSQSQLAEKLDLTRQQIANYESGEGTIPLASVIRLSEIFNITIDQLVKVDATVINNTNEVVHEPISYYAHSVDEMDKVKEELRRLKYRVEDYERVFKLMGVKRY